jgi:2-keto-4-pentenoate hydratase/2-oxohepta-3-ene-1,7-dioic acid hydratase in catechol pathway
MNDMTMTCVCTEEVSSVVLIPSSGQAIFNISKTATLENGDVLSSGSETVSVAVPSDMQAALLALMPKPTMPTTEEK